MSELIADILDDAADYIEKNGWYQGSLTSNRDGERFAPVCAIGAVAAVVGAVETISLRGEKSWLIDHRVLKVNSPGWHAVEAISRVAAEGWCVDFADVAVWNDQSHRTRQEVLDTFRLAAKNERVKA